MTGTCFYIFTTSLLVLIVVVYGLCRRIDGIDSKLDAFTDTCNQLKKFSKNMEALFKVEKQKKG